MQSRLVDVLKFVAGIALGCVLGWVLGYESGWNASGRKVTSDINKDLENKSLAGLVVAPKYTWIDESRAAGLIPFNLPSGFLLITALTAGVSPVVNLLCWRASFCREAPFFCERVYSCHVLHSRI